MSSSVRIVYDDNDVADDDDDNCILIRATTDSEKLEEKENGDIYRYNTVFLTVFF